MSIWNQYPYTDFHELNLDWIIKMVKEVTKEMNDFKVVNQIVWGGLHDPGKEYPRWCIVDTPTHEGYISIQPVPAGITVDNEDYWRQVANYSALYADFQNRIIALENVVGDSNSGLIKAVNNLQDDIAKMKKHFILIGDSYGTFPTVADSFPALFLDKAGICDASDYVYGSAAKINDEAYVYTLSGKAFVDGFPSMLSQVASICDNKDDITDIIVFSGINESVLFVDVATLENAMTSFDNVVKANFPNARVTLFNCGVHHSATANYVKQFTSHVTMRDKAVSLGWKYTDKARICIFNSTARADNTHPNAVGAVRLANHLYELMYNDCEPVVINKDIVNITASATNGSVTSAPIATFKWMDDSCLITIAPLAINKTASGTMVVTLSLNEGAIASGQPLNLQIGDGFVLPTVQTNMKDITFNVNDVKLAPGSSYAFGYLNILVPLYEVC